MEFHRGSPEAGFMCHVRAMEPKRPDNWKRIFLECHRCQGPKTKSSCLIGDSPPIVIWICIPCEKNGPSLRDIILSAPSMKDDPHNIPSFHGPEEEITHEQN